MRIHDEFARAQRSFAYVELVPTTAGGLSVKAALTTSASRLYVIELRLTNYPIQLPHVYVTAPTLLANVPHRYKEGNICFMHPSLWNPGAHDIEFVIARAAKWLNKFEVWREKGTWPGASMSH